MININKLFPRLSIRAKLAIAFALVALLPLAIVSVIGARETLAQIQSNARATLERDLEMSEAETARSLSSVEGHVDLMARLLLEPVLRAPSSDRDLGAAAQAVRTLVAAETALYQVKLIDADGRYRLLVRATGPPVDAGKLDGGEYYAWRASALKPHTRELFAIEVAGPEESGHARPTPAIAIVVPLHAPDGRYLGAVVGEAYASALFARLDHASPDFEGVTALVDEEGHFVYHSVRKRDWATLLAARDRLTVRSDFPDRTVGAILSGRIGTLTSDHELISFRPLSLGPSFRTRLSLYRAVPLASVSAPARSFLLLVTLAAVAVVLLVLGLAILAANQFTRPILRIHSAAWQLARGEPVDRPSVATNDELEDLARDFALVAEQVERDRAQREALIAERTRLLEHTDAELTDILKHSADAIIGLDPARVVTIWNEGAERLLGYPAAVAVGRDIATVFRPGTARSRREHAALRRELEREHAVVNFLTEVLAADGVPIQISVTATAISGAHGRPLGTSLIVRDNRVQSRLEDQMRRSERLAAISVMAAGLAHEINNPLAIIGNRVECMQRDVREKWPDTSLAADVDVLGQHVTRLRELTASLLRFAREDRDDPAPIRLDALAESTAALLRRTMAMRRVQLCVDVAADLPAITGHEKAIETVLVNLLLNAADATPTDGTVTLSVRPAARGGAVEIEVRDTGPGVPAELRERVFDPFFTTKGPGHGTGLGLAVCRSIIDRHGGSIGVEGRAPGDCRFIVTLPCNPAGAVWNELAYS